MPQLSLTVVEYYTVSEEENPDGQQIELTTDETAELLRAQRAFDAWQDRLNLLWIEAYRKRVREKRAWDTMFITGGDLEA